MSIEDKAQELEAEMWARNNRGRPEPKTFAPGDAGYGPQECDECLDEMPDLRRQYGFKLCTACQSAVEERKRRNL